MSKQVNVKTPVVKPIEGEFISGQTFMTESNKFMLEAINNYGRTIDATYTVTELINKAFNARTNDSDVPVALFRERTADDKRAAAMGDQEADRRYKLATFCSALKTHWKKAVAYLVANEHQFTGIERNSHGVLTLPSGFSVQDISRRAESEKQLRLKSEKEEKTASDTEQAGAVVEKTKEQLMQHADEVLQHAVKSTRDIVQGIQKHLNGLLAEFKSAKAPSKSRTIEVLTLLADESAALHAQLNEYV